MTQAERYVVGIDGGGTRTRYRLANGEGAILAGDEGGSSLLGAGRDAEIASDIETRVRAMAGEAGTKLPLFSLVAGLAGSAGRPEATAAFQAELLRTGIATRVLVLPDAEVAFEDAFGEGEGILIIAGTGSIALGRGSDGQLHRVGGWGALLGDEGSAYGIALQGIRAVMRGVEGIGEPTLLTAAVYRRLGVDSLRGILAWSQGAAKGEIAAVAPAVFETAAAGDRVAGQILDDAIEALVCHALALRNAHFPNWDTRTDPIPGALVGGIVEPGGPLHQTLVERLLSDGLDPRNRSVDPSRGALTMARRL